VIVVLDIANEVRRLQKLSALIARLQRAVNCDVSDEQRVDVSGALAAVVTLIDYEREALEEAVHQKELAGREVST
jgi:hypothetical protein